MERDGKAIDSNGLSVLDNLLVLEMLRGFSCDAEVLRLKLRHHTDDALLNLAGDAILVTGVYEDILLDKDFQTTLPGLFAAGDCTGGTLQVSIAVGEGAKAGLAAIKYIRENRA